jgi:hypothetical protein
MSNIVFTQEQIEFIIQCYNEHPSAKSISQKYRVRFGRIASQTITNFLKRNGYYTFSRGSKPPLSGAAKKLMMTAKFQRDKEEIDLTRYPDYEKISLLSKRFSIYRWKFNAKLIRLEFFEKFYFDQQYNNVFDMWRKHKYHKLLTPSIDHIIPTSRGGLTTLDNLQWLPVWENKAKATLTQVEWEDFKKVILL